MQDVRLAVRALRATPIVTIVAVLTLALGIGANTAIFSFIDGLLLAPLPYQHADRIVTLWERTPSGRRSSMTTLNYLDYAHSAVFEKIAATTGCCGVMVLGTAPSTPLAGFHVSATYFDILGVHAELGRTFAAGEDQAGRDHVVVISHRLWVSRFDADRGLIGRAILINGEPYTVVGVLPADGPFGRSLWDVWLPLSFPADRMVRTDHWLASATGGAIGLLKPGVTVDQARAELETVAARLSRDYPETNNGWNVVVEPLAAVLVSRELKRLLVLLLVAVGFVLLIGCVNVAHVVLARGLTREREIAIRLALGAGRLRLIRQFLTESLVLAVAGGGLGIGVGYVLMATLKYVISHQPLNPSFVPYVLPSEATIAIDGSALLFAAILSLVSAVGFGLVPAIRSTQASGDGSISVHRRASTRGDASSAQHLLIVTELALAFMLLAGAGLLLRSFVNMRSADLGYRGTNVLTASLPIWQHRFSNDDALRAHFHRILAAIERVPGVRDAALTDGLPLQGVPTGRFFQVVGRPVVDRVQRPLCFFKVVSGSYFQAMGLHVRLGRGIGDEDRFGAPYVVVINDTMARRHFPHVDPIGQHLLLNEVRPGTSDEIPWAIVGVIDDERLMPLDDDREEPVAYVPIDQAPTIFTGLVVRASGQPDALRGALRGAVSNADKDQPISDIKTADQLAGEAMMPDRLRTWFVGTFAVVALLLAAIGVYGVFAHAVVRRTHEIGIRVALGAARKHLVWLFVREGLALTAVALAVGLIGAVGVARLLRAFLFGISALDAIAISSAASGLALVAAIASYIPARRATSIDPLVAIRTE